MHFGNDTCKGLTKITRNIIKEAVHCSTEMAINLLTCWWCRNMERHKSNTWHKAWPLLLGVLMEICLASLCGFLLRGTVQLCESRSLEKLESCKYLFCAILGEDSLFSWEIRETLIFPKGKNGGWACRIVLFIFYLPPSISSSGRYY